MYLSLLFHKIQRQMLSKEHIAVSELYFELLLDKIKKLSLKADVLSVVNNPLSSGYKNSFAITFDDGWVSDYNIAFPKLLGMGMKGTFFITTEWVGKKGYVTRANLREMAQHGMEIGSHGVSHRYLTSLSPGQLQEELYSSRCSLEDILSQPVNILSIPGGECNSLVLNKAKEIGYSLIATSQPKINQAGSKIVGRISIHGMIRERQIENLISFSKTYVNFLYFSFYARKTLKKMVGIDRYKKIRMSLFGHS